jgi:hypothetical protein
MSEHRLGDVIDDYCIKCKRLTNHQIVSVMNAEPAKVRCQSCYNDHDYRREVVPPTKKEIKLQQMLEEETAKAAREASGAVTEPRP